MIGKAICPVKARSHRTSRLHHVQKSYEYLVNVVVSGNIYSIVTWLCCVGGLAVPLLKQRVSTANYVRPREQIHLSVMSRKSHVHTMRTITPT